MFFVSKIEIKINSNNFVNFFFFYLYFQSVLNMIWKVTGQSKTKGVKRINYHFIIDLLMKHSKTRLSSNQVNFSYK